MKEIIAYVIVIIIILYVFYIFLKYFYNKVLKQIINEIKEYKKSSEHDRDKIKMILYILLAPIILILLDFFDIFSRILPYYHNLTKDYDWLSFLGTYIGAIVSAILLIFITEKDREENTRVLRESQRPYLDVSYMKVKKEYFEKFYNENTIELEYGNSHDKEKKKKEYLTLVIKNNGESVAIIDVNKTKIIMQYVENKNIVHKTFFMYSVIERLSIKSGERIYIKFSKNELYKNGKLLDDSKLIGTEIYYKDLFNKNYFDKCELGETLKPINDNEEIN